MLMLMAVQNWPLLFRLVMAGEGNVGKSSLISKYMNSDPPYGTTLGLEVKLKIMTVEGREIKFQIWDGGGEHCKTVLTLETYFRGAHGIVLVYDVTKPESCDKINEWIKAIREDIKSEAKIVIVANKCDLSNDHVISSQKGQLLGDCHGIRHFEVSSIDPQYQTNIDKVFTSLVTDLKRKHDKIRV